MENKTIELSEKTKERMVDFFMKTSIPRILEKEKLKNERSTKGAKKCD